MNACRHGALRREAAGIKGSLPDLADSIYQCIHKKDGRILDEASEKLGAIRAQRQVTPAALLLTAHAGGIRCARLSCTFTCCKARVMILCQHWLYCAMDGDTAWQ